MEPAGIEPASQDNVCAGLYMLIQCFVVVRPAGHRHPTGRIRRLNLAPDATPSPGTSLLFAASASQTSALYRGRLYLGGHGEPTSAEADAASNITVIGS